jgi:hypothetical protein
MHNIRVIARGERGVAIARDFHAACPVACLSSAHAAAQDFRSKFDAEPTSVLVTTRKPDKRTDVPAHLAPGDVNILNLCGKINHATNTDNSIFAPGCVAMLTRVTDGFGVRLNAATIYGNFVTSPHVRIYNSKLETPKCRILFLFFYSGFCFYSFFRKANK